MNANELMLGDWVQDTFFDRNVPRRVEIIEPYRVWLEGNNMYQPRTTIEPIPLTKEILEKNGMELHEFTASVASSEGTLYYNSKERCLYAQWGKYSVPPFCRIDFVHELQHILRLCGIEKDIEL